MSTDRPLIHLVGSIPLDDSETVFRTVSDAVGPRLSRLPDGETGKRVRWIGFLEGMLNENPDMEIDTEVPPQQLKLFDGTVLREVAQYKFKDGADLSKVTFDTGYADAALDSFATFDRLQNDGVIPASVRFQVCLPTPIAPAYHFMAQNAQDDFIRVYGDHIIGEVAKICAAIPRERLAFQWDVCQEVLMWEAYYGPQPADYKEETFSVLARIGDAVPEPAELGYHLCYGSPGDEHMVLPDDMANMVEMIRGILSGVDRSIQFIHLPVPKDRVDDAYFAPLGALDLPADTELHLGLVHHDDADGDARRLDAAMKFAKITGVSSECGWGRSDPSRVTGLLASHDKAAARLADG